MESYAYIKSLWISIFLMVTYVTCAMDVSVEIDRFHSEKGDCIEVSSYFLGNSVAKTQLSSGNFESKIHMLMTISKLDSDMKWYESYEIGSQASRENQDFMDQRRIGLSMGQYIIDIRYQDLLDTTNIYNYQTKLNIGEAESEWSDIQLLTDMYSSTEVGPFRKQGMYCEVLPYSLYHQSLDKLIFYVENYNQDNGYQKRNLIGYGIYEGYYGEKGQNVGLTYKYVDQGPIVPIAKSLDIKDLKSGNYHLKIARYDDTRSIISSSYANFIRLNPRADSIYLTSYNSEVENSFVSHIEATDLDEYLKILKPKVFGLMDEIWSMVLKGDDQVKRAFLFHYWQSINKESPYVAFNAYNELIQQVNSMFHSNVGAGWQTDRGDVYIKYGAPSDVISIDYEMSAPPYEIWYYNYVSNTKQTNVRFLFYNESLVPNDYQLLHSTCRGELQNPRWEVELYEKAPKDRIGNPINGTQVEENWDRHARFYMER